MTLKKTPLSTIFTKNHPMKNYVFFSIVCFILIPTLTFGQEGQKSDSVYTSLSDALKNPERVLRLDLSNQSIVFEPGTFELFTNLEYLSLKNDHLKVIPAGIMKLKNLRTLDLSGNDFMELPSNFGDLTNLESLYLNDEKNMKLEPT
jgi:Leucine-rich repeat (LRR) protein